jgi:hypothetical protein
MATTVSYSASMRTRKSNSASNYKATAASQEFYTSDYNFVGIVHFSGLSLLNKIITGLTLRVTSAEAGFGAGSTKTVYLRKSKYQAASQSGITGGNYYGDALGTFTGSFYGNTTSYDFSGALFNNVAAYLQAGNNTFCLYNPSPSASGQGYSYNYLQWTAVTLYVTYEEGISQPRVSASTVEMGATMTIFTDRLSTSATHTISYTFAGASGVIGTGIGESVYWAPSLVLAQRIPSATSGLCTITCDTYYAGVLTGTKTCTFTLTVPGSVVPTISGVSYSEAVAGIAAQFGGLVQSKSKLAVSITASGAQGSTITTYRSTLNGTAYTASSFTTNVLSVPGNSTLSVTVTDSRGRTATTTRTISVLAYAPPTLSLFKAERCNATGSAPQTDGNRVRISATAGASPVDAKNTLSCTVYYKLSSSSTWTQATTIAHSNYAIASTNLLLSQTFDVLSSFDLMIRITDFFHFAEQSVSIGTKQVMMDFYRNGTGIAFGKVAETQNAVELGWPLILAQPLSVPQGGTGADNAASACSNLGAVKKAGDTMTGNLSIQSSLYPSVYLLPTYNNTTNRTVFEGSYVGASSFAAWEDSSGSNRRMLEVRTAAYAPSMDNAVLLRTAVGGSFYAYRVFHAGMATPVPVANGGTGASGAKAAINNLGIFYSATLPGSGTDGQICLVPV